MNYDFLNALGIFLLLSTPFVLIGAHREAVRRKKNAPAPGKPSRIAGPTARAYTAEGPVGRGGVTSQAGRGTCSVWPAHPDAPLLARLEELRKAGRIGLA
jgi:hypothetical protein